MMYTVTMVVRDNILLISLRLFHCLPNFAWAAQNCAEMAEEMGKIEGLQK